MLVCPECNNKTRMTPCSACQPFGALYEDYKRMQDMQQDNKSPWPFKPKLPTTSGINEVQIGGNHYKTKGIQPWDYITSNNMGFLEGCIIKYVSRYKDKGGMEDLKKAQHFLEKLIEVRSAQG